jgi:hypothetical protein
MPKTENSGHIYSTLVYDYVTHNYLSRGITVHREITLGKTIIGKNRRVDMLIIDEKQNLTFAIECKFQDVHGTADEKIPYAIEDVEKMPIAGCICYAGKVFSAGVLHLLESHPKAIYCLPSAELVRDKNTRELDQALAIHFHWWDVLVRQIRH